MLALFTRDFKTKRVLMERIASAKRNFVRAMQLHGINSDRARAFDKLVTELEAELNNV